MPNPVAARATNAAQRAAWDQLWALLLTPRRPANESGNGEAGEGQLAEQDIPYPSPRGEHPPESTHQVGVGVGR